MIDRSTPKPNRPRLHERLEERLAPVERSAAEAYTAAEELASAIEDPAGPPVPELISNEDDSLAQALRDLEEHAADTNPEIRQPPSTEYSFIRPRWSKPRGKR